MDGLMEARQRPSILQRLLNYTGKKNPLGAKRPGKAEGGLGARKLTTKSSDGLYEQKQEEPPMPISSAASSNGSTPIVESSFASRFEFTDSDQCTYIGSGGARVISHVTPPKSSELFNEYGMESGLPKNGTSNSSKVQVEETNEARKKFSNAKSISSSQFFGVQNNDLDSSISLQKFSGSSSISSADFFGHCTSDSMDLTASDLINRLSFQAQQDISSVKSIAGETSKKISTLASTLLTDFQDRIL